MKKLKKTVETIEENHWKREENQQKVKNNQKGKKSMEKWQKPKKMKKTNEQK